jgi:membrane fusion protein (multidrug efflux system)
MLSDPGSRADDQNGEQVLLERAQPPSSTFSSPDRIDRKSARTNDEAVRARAPVRGEQPFSEQPVVDAPPLHDDQPADQDGHRADKPSRAGLLRRHPFASVVGLLLLIPTVGAGYLYWDNAQHFESTDDSFIAARQFSIAPEVSGYITAVPVTDNQHVNAGTVIARIDDRNYRIAHDQAKAQLAHDQALLAQAQTNLARYQFLVQQNSIARQTRDDQKYLVDQDKATVDLDQANVANAQLNLDHTIVKADQAGRVVSLTAAVGQYTQPGTTLTTLVPDDIWVTANFKETQLGAMRSGQPVTLTIDAYPDRTIRGHIASVQSGSGPAFSLLPPENATGNWVKIVQRVPVKIVMDNPPTDVALGPGMSVETTVRVNSNPALYERLKGWIDARLGGRL